MLRIDTLTCRIDDQTVDSLTFSNTRSAQGVIDDDPAPEKPANSLKTNGPEKRRNHRQKSSFIVKT